MNRPDAHTFGFNGQERKDDYKGKGNHNHALYWEYDTRIGRRWNLDPKPNPSISDYSTFSNSPIWLVDPYGDSSEFRNQHGELVKHIKDQSNAVYQQKGGGVNLHYEFVGFDPALGGGNVVDLKSAIQEAQNLNLSNPSLEPANGETYCNFATQNILSTVSSATSQPGLKITGMANSMVPSFRSSPLLLQVDEDVAGFNAENGRLSLIGYINPTGHGHVVTYSVGENMAKGQLANVGRENGFKPVITKVRGDGGVFGTKSAKTLEFFILNKNVQPKYERPRSFFDFNER